MYFRALFVLLVAVAVSLTAFAQASDSVGMPGKLIIAGGGIKASEAELWKHMIQERLADRPIGIISTASATPVETCEATSKSLNEKYGEKTTIAIPLSEEDDSASDPKVIALIKNCGGFYFTGGLQSRTMRALYTEDDEATPALTAIWEVYETGAVIGGSSAGAAIMSDPMILNGSSAKALLNGVTGVTTDSKKRGVGLGHGLGFHPEILYCQHHIERGRFGRLLTALASEDFPQTAGVGIAEDSFVLVDRQKQEGRVLGARGALYLDASMVEKGKGGLLRNVLVHRLEPGDTIQFATGSVQPGEGKEPLQTTPKVAAPILYEDAWAKDAIWDLIADLAPLEEGSTAEALDEKFRLIFTKTPQSEIWERKGEAPNEKPGWTVSGLEVSLERR